METELKFQVPGPRRDAVQRAVATATARSTRLQAVYFDTADRRLAAAGLALRLRKEGRVWVQALKGGHGLVTRLEHEVPLAARGGEPAPDPQRHAGTPAGDALAAALSTAGDPALLQPVFRADVRRLHRLARFGGAQVEIAYDRGLLLAGPRRQALDEVEFELKGGPPAALAELAQRWVVRFGLWWDVRPKSEQGLRLALDQRDVPPTRAAAAVWPQPATPRQVWAASLQSALAQALPNAAELAGGTGTPEHLHQLRVALRRLRAALRLFAPWGGDEAAALALEADWRGPFALLGAARDADVLAQTLAPRLRRAGAPPLALPDAATGADAAGCCRGTAFNILLLRTLALSWQDAAAGVAPPPLADAARDVLRPAWRALLRDADRLAEATVEARHRTRKRLKRLRYALEFLLPLYPRKATHRLQRALADALTALGELNDIQMAHQVCIDHAQAQPQAWFAVGWLAAQREPALERAQVALRGLHSAPRPWREK